MSGIAALFNVPENPEQLLSWGASHQTHHRDISRVIYELSGISLDEFVLDPINPEDTGVWEYQHQQMHQDMEAVLGISGFDLTGVDFKDYQALTGWINLHSNSHYQASIILGIG